MSLWFPVMVNNTEIGRVIIRRTEPFKDAKNEYQYEWYAEWQLPPRNPLHAATRTEPEIMSIGGELKHDYRAGAMSLIAKVMDGITE